MLEMWSAPQCTMSAMSFTLVARSSVVRMPFRKWVCAQNMAWQTVRWLFSDHRFPCISIDCKRIWCETGPNAIGGALLHQHFITVSTVSYVTFSCFCRRDVQMFVVDSRRRCCLIDKNHSDVTSKVDCIQFLPHRITAHSLYCTSKLLQIATFRWMSHSNFKAHHSHPNDYYWF